MGPKMHGLVRIQMKRLGAGMATASRIGLGLLFLWDSLQGIRWPYEFLGNMYEYELTGPRLGILLAMVVPWLELVMGVCLLGGVIVTGALLASILFLGTSALARGSLLWRGASISSEHFHFLGNCAPKDYMELVGMSVLCSAAMASYAFLLLSHQDQVLEAGEEGRSPPAS